MKLLLVTSASLAAAVGMAVPACADSKDDAFLASLHAAGITYPGPGRVVEAGKWVCRVVGQGMRMADVVKIVQAHNPGLHGDNAARFTAIAANVYCPQALQATSGAPDSGSAAGQSSAGTSSPSPVSVAGSGCRPRSGVRPNSSGPRRALLVWTSNHHCE